MKNKLTKSLLFLLLTVLATACGTKEIPAEVFEAGNGPYISKLADDLYFVEDFNNGGNICFLVAKKGVLLVDAGNFPGPVKKVADIIAKLTDKPITHLIYTHVHGDHVGGSAGLPDDITIIAHENLNDNLAEFFTPGLEAFKKEVEVLGEDSLRLRYGERYDDIAAREVRAASQTFSDSKVLDMGNYSVELSYPGTCHTSDNIYVLFREQKVLHTGDLVFNKRHPFISTAYQADPWAWSETVKEWSEKDLVKVIPGHGEIGGAEILAAQADYLNTLIKAVEEYKDSDMEAGEIAQVIHNKYFSDYNYGRFFEGGVQLILDK